MTVRRNSRYKDGYIDVKGQWVIEARFDQGGDFLGELAPVRLERKWGYIDRVGRFVVLPTFREPENSMKGLRAL